jgi:hypothetical protein
MTGGMATNLTDALARASIEVPTDAPELDRCVVTVGSLGYERWVEGLFGSILANSGATPPTLALFALADDAAAAEKLSTLASRYGALCFPCRPLRRPNPTTKSILYSAARVIPARRFVCMDADTVVCADVESLFVTIDTCAPGSILVCREANDRRYADLEDILLRTYHGGSPPFCPPDSPAARYQLVVNDGLFAGDRDAMLALDEAVRRLPGAIDWVDEDPAIDYRNQFAFNTALAHLGTGVELDPTWNVQLHAQELDVSFDGGRPVVRWRGRDARMVHFCAPAKQKYPELRDWAVTCHAG